MRNVSDKAPDVERGRMSKLRLLLLGCASLIAPGVMLIQLGRADAVDMPVLIGASVLLFVLVDGWNLVTRSLVESFHV